MAMAERRNERGISLEQYAALPEEERFRVEAVRGRLVREPRPAPLHARVQARLIGVLDAYERAHPGTGAVVPEVEFVLSVDPLTVRIPDVAWVSAARVPSSGYALPRWHFAPDLAAEVVSPRNRPAELEERVADYLLAGSMLVWVLDPRTRTVAVHQPGAASRLLDVTDQLTAEALLPDFAVPVAELFPR